MCGIIGINEQNEAQVRIAASLFAYRGPDATRLFSDARVTLGHHRLSILDIDPRSHQPMASADGALRIVFNGEIYNFKQVKEQLSGKYQFKTTSDTEVLLCAYKEWGVNMTEQIRGMYAFALYDTAQQKIVLMRDHVGIKPLYYYAKAGVFAFASEMKGLTALLSAKGLSLKVLADSVELFITLGYVPSPYTIYEDVFRVERSSVVEYDLSARAISKKATYRQNVSVVKGEEEFAQLLETQVLSHLVSDVPVGVFFSGGTDSSLVAAILQKHRISLETFSIAVDRKAEDQAYFKRIGVALQLKTNVFSFGVDEFDAVYEEVMSKIDEPTHDNSIFPTYFVSKKAAEKVKVVLSGEGGDEYFFGYHRDTVLSKLSAKQDYNITWLDRLFFLMPNVRSKNALFERFFILFGQPFSFYLLHMSPSKDLASLEGWRLWKGLFRQNATTPRLLDQDFYLEGDLLRKTDFATSYVSIEGRVPLLDVDVVRNSTQFSDQSLVGGVSKAFLKKILTRYLPKELVYRNKSGFGIDLRGLFKSSRLLKRELVEAQQYLRERLLLRPEHENAERLMARYPNLAFALISLFRVLKNVDFSGGADDSRSSSVFK
ncbi:MAG: asparagine synthase (glutamine-hydrolyzing) [bacterium]